MDTWKKCLLSAGKPMSIKFLVLGGGGVFWVWGGGEVPILFLWARGFSDSCTLQRFCPKNDGDPEQRTGNRIRKPPRYRKRTGRQPNRSGNVFWLGNPQKSELFAMPIQLTPRSRRKFVYQTGILVTCCRFFPGEKKKQNTEFPKFFSPAPGNSLDLIFQDWPPSGEF